MIVILLLGDEGGRNACFTDKSKALLYSNTGLVSCIINLSGFIHHHHHFVSCGPRLMATRQISFLNTKKCREEALIPEDCCADIQTKNLETHGLPRVCTSAFAYSFKHVLIESPLSLDSWNCHLIGLSASAGAPFQSILSSAFRMILSKPVSLSFSPGILGPLQLKPSLPHTGPTHGPQSTL